MKAAVKLVTQAFAQCKTAKRPGADDAAKLEAAVSCVRAINAAEVVMADKSQKAQMRQVRSSAPTPAPALARADPPRSRPPRPQALSTHLTTIRTAYQELERKIPLAELLAALEAQGVPALVQLDKIDEGDDGASDSSDSDKPGPSSAGAALTPDTFPMAVNMLRQAMMAHAEQKGNQTAEQREMAVQSLNGAMRLAQQALAKPGVDAAVRKTMQAKYTVVARQLAEVESKSTTAVRLHI